MSAFNCRDNRQSKRHVTYMQVTPGWWQLRTRLLVYIRVRVWACVFMYSSAAPENHVVLTSRWQRAAGILHTGTTAAKDGCQRCQSGTSKDGEVGGLHSVVAGVLNRRKMCKIARFRSFKLNVER